MKLKGMLALVLSVVLLISFAGCAAKEAASDSMNRYDGGNGYAAQESNDGISLGVTADSIVKEDAESVQENPQSSLPKNRKLIQKLWISAETEDMDVLLANVEARIAQLGGYVEAQQVYNGSAYSGRRYRNGELTIRIPAGQVDLFVEQVAEVSNIVSNRKTMDDITLSYVATESRIKALEIEEGRLLELLAMAETMDDLLTIESRLTDVRAELEQVKSTLRLYDNQVDYATVYLSVSEVKEYTVVTEPETVWERIGEGFINSVTGLGKFFRELFVFVIVASPYLILIGGVVVLLVVLIRGKKRKKAKKAQENK